MERDPNLTGILFHAIHRAHHNALQAELSARGADLGSPLLMMLLQSRGKDGALPAQRELADALRVSPASVAMSLKSLERMGYVEKRPDPTDGRRKRVAVTPQGEKAVETCWMVFQTTDRRMMEGFTDEEREKLNEYHRRMIQNLHNGPGGKPENPFEGCEERMECQCSKP